MAATRDILFWNWFIHTYVHTQQSELFLVFPSGKKKRKSDHQVFPRAILELDSSDFFCSIYFVFG